MGGLMVLTFYGIFWWFCWKLSGIFNYQKARDPIRKRKWICFWILMTPMYFHAFEFVFLWNECANSSVYLPEKKIKRPNVLITNNGNNQNIGESFRGASKFDYMISPRDLGYDTVNFNIGRKQFSDYVVYQDALKKTNPKQNIVLGK